VLNWQVRVGADAGNAGQGNVEHVEHQTFDVANHGKQSLVGGLEHFLFFHNIWDSPSH
jgi:hypothetical protein